MMESIGSSLSESSGVEIRAKMVGLILPTMLATATSDAVTYIPGANDEVEIFKVRRVAGSNFGDLKRGEEIDSTTVGQYSQMRQRYKFPAAQQPDGTKTEFAFKAKTDLSMGIDIPVKKGTAAIYYNRRRVATDFDQKNGRLYGEVPQTDGTMISISGTVDYTNCSIVVTPATALPAGELHVMFEIDIEASPELIPTIDHDMTSCKLRPSQAAIAADATIQAMFAMNREYNIDLKSMQMSHLRNFLANEKAVRHLTDIDFACVNESTFNLYCPADADWKLHRELLRQTLLNISTNILELTKTVGLIGMFAGRQACTVLKSMGQTSSSQQPATSRPTTSISLVRCSACGRCTKHRSLSANGTCFVTAVVRHTLTLVMWLAMQSQQLCTTTRSVRTYVHATPYGNLHTARFTHSTVRTTSTAYT